MWRYSLPLLSGILLALVFWPLYAWPLALIGLAPLFYFIARPELSRGQVFFGGFIAGALAVAPTLYTSLFQLVMQPGAAVLTYSVRASSVFFFVFIGALFGGMALAYRALRGRGALLDSLCAASLYTVVELILFTVFGGYYYASLAHALVPFPPALIIASLGGVPLLVFAAAWINAVVAQRSWCLALGAFIFLSIICGGAFWYGQSHATAGLPLSVALIQRSPQSLLYTTAPAPKPFGDYGLQKIILSASGGGSASLVVYPFSPVEATYIGVRPAVETLDNIEPDSVVGEWLKSFVPASTTVVLWNTAAEHGNLYDEIEFWNNGLKQTYQKHLLHALSDYTPRWLQRFGLARIPYSLMPGAANSVSIDGIHIGNLACSETQQETYARRQAAGSGLLLSVGFDSFFPGSLAPYWSLQAARLRAAENGTPLIRSSIFGPSALIAADGTIQTEFGFDETGVLHGSITIEKIPTLYAYAGSLPVYLFIAALLLYLLVLRINNNSDARRRG